MTTSGPEPYWLGRVDRWTRSHGWAGDVLAALAVLAVLGALSVSAVQGIRWSTGWIVTLIACFAVLPGRSRCDRARPRSRTRWPRSRCW